MKNDEVPFCHSNHHAHNSGSGGGGGGGGGGGSSFPLNPSCAQFRASPTLASMTVVGRRAAGVLYRGAGEGGKIKPMAIRKQNNSI